MTTPYPAIYVPQHLPIGKPSHCPHVEPFGCYPDVGPDAAGGGVCWGLPYDKTNPEDWIETAEGWWICWNHPSPQQLVNLAPSPHLVAWHWIDGARPGQRWRIPQLLVPADDEATAYEATTNRIWTGEEWALPPPLASVQHRLLLMALDQPLAGDDLANAAAIRRLAMDVLALGHHVSQAELLLGEWFDELLMVQAIATACGHPPQRNRHAPQVEGVREELARAG